MNGNSDDWQKDAGQFPGFVQERRQIQMECVIKGPPLHTLADILPKKTVAELRDMADMSLLSGVSKLKKAELLKTLLKTLPEKNQVAAKLSILSVDQWSFFCRVLETEELRDAEVLVDSYLLAQNLGLLQSFSEGGEVVFVVPDEIKRTCRALRKGEVFTKIEQGVFMKEYATAAVNLYGILPLDELVAIYNTQNEEKTDAEEMFGVLSPYAGEALSNFHFWKEYLVHPDFEEYNFEAVEDLAEDVEGKPRYVPEKEEFLRYADEFYQKETPQSEKLEAYLRAELGMDAQSAREIVVELTYMAAGEEPWQELVDTVLESIDTFKSDAQADAFFSLLADLSNNTRIWSNKGFTPKELYTRMAGPVLRVVDGGKRKVGRNEPCPCGSGKKYKHCCGQT